MTVINGPVVIYSFVEFAGFNRTSNISYTFNDTISQSLTLSTDTVDYCGSKDFSFTINSTSTTWLTGNNTQNITYSPPTKTTAFGTFLAVLTVCMNAYTTICTTVPFSVTTLGSQVPTIPN